MLITFGLVLVACVSALWLAYGINPSVVRDLGGLDAIMLTRRLQWVLLIATIIPALGLIVRVSIGRARAWWLVTLSLVVAMMLIRFGPTTQRPVRVLDAAALPTLAEMPLANGDEFVVAMVFNGKPYALPYRSLFRTPVVQLTDRAQRVVVIFSPFANSATALDVSREVRASDLEFVASPGNSTLVYNRKYGQFIVGLTGATPAGEMPTGVLGIVPTWRMPLSHWRRLHPDSLLMLPTPAEQALPGVPLMPKYAPRTHDTSLPPATPIVLLHTDPPAALLAGARFDEPVHTKAGDRPVVLWRRDGVLRAFERTVDQDLYLTFRIERDRDGEDKLIDEQTRSTWTLTGRATGGELRGEQLVPLRVDEGVYWGVTREWWPGVELIRAE